MWNRGQRDPGRHRRYPCYISRWQLRRTGLGVDIHRQRMDTRHDVSQSRMNSAMPRDTGLPFESCCPYTDIEMALATFAVSGMPPMAFTVIDHFQLAGIKCRLQAVTDFVGYVHFYADRQINCRPPLLLFAT